MLVVGIALVHERSKYRSHDAATVVVPPSGSVVIQGATDVPHVHFSTERQKAAGVQTAEVDYVDLSETIAVTGKLTVNDDRLGHI